MNKMKFRVIFGFLCIIFGSVFCIKNTYAYWTDNGNGVQCYATQYKKTDTSSKRSNEYKQCVQACSYDETGVCGAECLGQYPSTTTTTYSVSSTEQICANVDDSGAIISLYKDALPDGTDGFSKSADATYPRLSFFDKIITSHNCGSKLGPNVCWSWDRKSTSYTTETGTDYIYAATFKELAQKIQANQIQSSGQYTILGFDENTTNEEIAKQNTVVTGTSSSASSSSTETTSDPCYLGAGSLGWGICPIIAGISSGMGGIYETFVEPLVKVDPQVVHMDSGTHTAWSIFRNIANIVFVIFLLVVIFSQLTGVGISNYGIKKALPKLIITAVLINLSFIICQTAVDLSNILGSSLNNFLSSIAFDVLNQAQITNVSSNAGLFNGILSVVVGSLGVTIGTVTAVAVFAPVPFTISGMALIIPILCALISAVIAVIFFFVILGVRQAGVILAVVIAPLAFACYLLPNTKTLFDKWLKIFKGLLVVYPLCGILIGGGSLASAVLIVSASDNFLIYLIGLLVMVIPFFFLPTLFKNSMSALGNLGDKISGLGKQAGGKLSGRADKAMRNSNLFNDAQRQAKLRGARASAKRLQGKTNLSPRQARQLAINRGLVDKAEQEDELSMQDAMLEGKFRTAEGQWDYVEMEKRFQTLRKQDNLSAAEASELRGITKKLMTHPTLDGNVYKAMRESGNGTSAAAVSAWRYMNAHDSDFSSSLYGKSQALSNFMLSNDTTYNEDENMAAIAGSIKGNQLVGQETHDLEKMLGVTRDANGAVSFNGSSMISDNVIQSIMRDEALMSSIKGAKADIIRGYAQHYNISAAQDVNVINVPHNN